MKKWTIPEVLPTIKGYMEDNPGGGNLHIALEDGNLNDDHILFCLNRAAEDHDGVGIWIADRLLTMSMTQRKKIYRLIY